MICETLTVYKSKAVHRLSPQNTQQEDFMYKKSTKVNTHTWSPEKILEFFYNKKKITVSILILRIFDWQASKIEYLKKSDVLHKITVGIFVYVAFSKGLKQADMPLSSLL